jgi:hypothetical protein
VAGLVVAGRKGAAVGLGAGQRVVLVGGIAAAVDDVALLGQGALLRQIVVAVQFVDIFGDDDALGVLPRAVPDAVARIDRGLAVRGLRAEIGMPGVTAGPRALREPLTDLVGPGQTAEIGTFAGPGAGDKKGHVGLLRPRAAAHD